MACCVALHTYLQKHTTNIYYVYINTLLLFEREKTTTTYRKNGNKIETYNANDVPEKKKKKSRMIHLLSFPIF